MAYQKPLLTEFGIHLGKLWYVISICDQMVYLVCQPAWGGPVSESLLKCKQPSSLQGRLLISQPLPWMAAPQTFCLSLEMNQFKSHFEAIKFEILKQIFATENSIPSISFAIFLCTLDLRSRALIYRLFRTMASLQSLKTLSQSFWKNKEQFLELTKTSALMQAYFSSRRNAK